jgi:hypothetical protein
MRELNDRERIEEIVRRAKAERSRAVGEFIANQIFAVWTGLKHVGALLATPAAKHRVVLGLTDPR